MDVNAKLTLDSSNFDANMKKSGDNATATGRAAAKAARESAAAQAVAAKFVGDTITMESRKALEAIKARSSADRDFNQVQKLVAKGLLDEKTGADAAAAAYQRKAAAQKAAAAVTEKHPEVSSRMAASAAVRGLENGNVGIRSVENLLTTIPGVSKLLLGIFPLLGGIGLAGAFFEMGEKGKEAFDKVMKSAAATRDAFQALHERAQVQIDDTRVETARLQEEIDKLSGHPNNGLALALEEARKKADELLVSLRGDRNELEALFKENRVGGMASLFTGVAATGKQESEMLSDTWKSPEAVNKANADFDRAVSGAKTKEQIKAAGDQRTKTITEFFQKQIDSYTNEAKRLKGVQAKAEADANLVAQSSGETMRVEDQGKKVANLEGRAGQLQQKMQSALEQRKLEEAQVKLGEVKQQKELGKEDNKAATERLRKMEVELTELHLLGRRTIGEDEDFWRERIGAFKKGSGEYREIVSKWDALAEEGGRRIASGLEKMREHAKTSKEEQGKMDAHLAENPRIRSWDLEGSKNFDDKIDASNERAAVAARNVAREREMEIGEAAGRTMTRQAAAAALAAVHTAAYGAELDRLLAKQKMVSESSWLTDDEKTKALAGLDTQVADNRSQRAIQTTQDNYALNPADTTLLTGIRQAVEDFTLASKDMGKAVEATLSSALNSTNEGILRSLTERHTQGQHIWGNVGGDIFKNVSGSALKTAEGKGLDLLSKTKFGEMLGLSGDAPKGTSGDPFYVRMVESTASKAGSLFGTSMGSDGGSDSDSGSGGGGFMGGLVSALSGVVPGFANGTENFGGGLAMVGERGPELLRLPRGSAVTPNHRLGRQGGSGGTFAPTIHVTGNADPAQVMAMVHEGLAQAAPMYMKMSVGANRDFQARRPATAR